MPVTIGRRRLGPGQPTYVIAEAGVNHNGRVETARQLVIAAKRAGADCVKFQAFSAEAIATASAPKAGYQLRTTDPAESQIDMLRKLELTPGSLTELKALCAGEGIDFLATPYSPEDVDVLAALGVEAYKIASAMLVEPDFLRRVARERKPILISTGMSTMNEISHAVSVVRDAGNPSLVLLQCSTNYPTAPEDANVRAMTSLAQTFGVTVGFSDHTQSMAASVAAVALGASVIEKHFTLDPAMAGPDQSTSADPQAFRALVDMIRETERVLGSADKKPTEAERQNLIGMRRSLVAIREIRSGTAVSADMLRSKRPATGIAPRDLDRIIGSIARVDIRADQTLEWWMFEGPADPTA